MGQMGQFCLRQPVGRQVGIDGSQMTDLLCHNGADACEMIVQGLLNRHGRGFYDPAEIRFRDGQRVLFCYCLRDKVFPSGQNLPYRTHIGGHVLDAVNDRAVFLTENDIAVLSHDLYDQLFSAQVAHFVQMLQLKFQDTLQPRLGDGKDPGASDMLS